MVLLSKEINEESEKNFFKFIKSNPDKPWNWYEVSRNPNITMEFIEANPDKPWDWREISRNDFKKERELIRKKLIKEYEAATKIQRSFKKYRYDPKYPFCKRVLINNLEECGVKF